MTKKRTARRRSGKDPARDKHFARIFSEFRGEEGDLIPILQKTQERFGFIPREAVRRIARFLKISENQIYGVASFYSQFRFTAPGRNSIKVCLGTACHVRGGQILCDAVERELDLKPGGTTEDRRYDLERVACLGCCALAPVVQVNADIHSRMTVIRLKETLDKYE
ncbi:MAG: NAD(P)H-dependent oxidoreductase subunit E [Candidatus Zixiibacteriota bacterium]|nr:MAG: NAD(P)H-dependent oxidoreductase subunit E [candidate division Zixibacteria bacterium]